MTKSKSVVVMNHRELEYDMFSGLEPLTALEVKKDYLATQLTALMIHCGKTRSEMADELGWQKSRVTKVLSGHDNLTIKSICEFSTHLGYDFDVVFHSDEQPRPRQPWQIQDTEMQNLPIDNLQILNLPFNAQSPGEVFIDILSGNGRKEYWSFDTQMFGNGKTIDVATSAFPASVRTDSIPTDMKISVMQII